MKWIIAADSSSDLHAGLPLPEHVGLTIAPLTIQAGGMSFVDDVNLDVRHMMDTMASATGTTGSACPSPDAWLQAFGDAECVFAVTISSHLSGCYNAAVIARDLALEQNPNRKIAVIDSMATSGQMQLIVMRLGELIGQGLSFEAVLEQIEAYIPTLNTLFTLSSFDNLVRNGRMPKIVGVLAKRLKMRIIGRGVEGKIEVVHKCRGEQSTLMTLLKDMKADGDLSQKHVVLTHCFNPKLAMTFKNLLEMEAPGVRVTVGTTHALTSYYAEESGLIISY